jgi:hypothetical protein
MKNKNNKNKILIIYSHGNASDIGDVSAYANNISFFYNVKLNDFNILQTYL